MSWRDNVVVGVMSLLVIVLAVALAYWGPMPFVASGPLAILLLMPVWALYGFVTRRRTGR